MLHGVIIWKEGTGIDSEEFMPNLVKTLSNLPCGGLQHKTVVRVDDTSQNLRIPVYVRHEDDWDAKDLGEFPFLAERVARQISAGALSMSLEEIQSGLDKCLEKVGQSSLFQKFKTSILSLPLASPISTIVCYGVGNFGVSKACGPGSSSG